jgi:hypothetical protein
MIARSIALLCLLALLAPPAAPAQQTPFDPLPPAPQPQAPPPEEPEDPRERDDGLSSSQQLLIGVSGIILVAGIAWAILRDARSAAPVVMRRRGGREDEDVHRPKGSQKPAGARHRQSRAKAKAARQARKKARKR